METIRHSHYMFTLDSEFSDTRAIARGLKNDPHGGILIIKGWIDLRIKITLPPKLQPWLT
jgi:hypothetical protein